MTRGCGCLGCLTDGRCDDGADCSHGCGGLAANPWGTCDTCERELTGRAEEYDMEGNE